ncbi:unnamed protein product [Adineta steineri]|uniref:Uncharacterized protein n=1 Tax=Adineta steineri TaxID=433720 RepID=A0A813XCS9_9BILA|nr:unnamed protein product [Adineta steineri]CAF0868113.1 unnamed protein product [Adineta steineri]
MLFISQISVIQAKKPTCDNQVNCLVDPCKFATCKKYPTAVCRSNYCGGCFADFYVRCKKVDCGNTDTGEQAVPA